MAEIQSGSSKTNEVAVYFHHGNFSGKIHAEKKKKKKKKIKVEMHHFISAEVSDQCLCNKAVEKVDAYICV